MSLNDTQLYNDILAILDGSVPVADATEAGAAWGDALHDYSVDGVVENPALTFIPVVGLDLSVDALKLALRDAFSTIPGSPATVAADMTSAFSAYWLTGTFAAIPPVAVGAPALTAALTAILSQVSAIDTHVSKATEISNALTAFVKALTVTYPGPTPPAGTFNVE